MTVDFNQASTNTQIIQIKTDAEHSEINWENVSKPDPSNLNDFEKKVNKIITEIKQNPEWLSDVQKKADQKCIPLDSMIYHDAVYMAKRH